MEQGWGTPELLRGLRVPGEDQDLYTLAGARFFEMGYWTQLGIAPRLVWHGFLEERIRQEAVEEWIQHGTVEEGIQHGCVSGTVV